MFLSRAVQRIILTARTVRFIKFSQLYFRIWFKFRWTYPPDTKSAPELRPLAGWCRALAKTPSATTDGNYTFLNQTIDFSDGIDWSGSSASRLWLYNLHYFDFINSSDAIDNRAVNLEIMRDWVSANPPIQGTGWEPYPASLRIVNWVKWLISNEEYPNDVLDSLAGQIRWLSKNVEYHILANHVFTNGKALVYAGVFFRGAEANRWLAQGLGIVNSELNEQILKDGGHFERSPMYHHIIVEDLLDMLNLTQSSSGCVSGTVLQNWREAAGRMLGWAQRMCHPKGQLAFFNDAAYGIAQDLAKLKDYAQRLEIPFESLTAVEKKSQLLEGSGFALLNTASIQLIADIGPVGPDYQPGHAHADTLSFELAFKGELVIVNSGTSTYETGAQRQFERSTRAHSTVEVNELDSSEVWAGFRVARRAQPFDIQFETRDSSTSLKASHSGYHRLASPVTHTRKWELGEASLEITDWLSGDFKSAIARFYLHPDVQVSKNNELKTKSGNRIIWEVQGGIANIERSFWYPGFGRSVENQHISIAVTESPMLITLHFL